MPLIKRTTELKKAISWISASFEFDNIESFISDAEFEFIIPLIGSEQFAKLQEIYGASGEPNDKQKELLFLVQKSIANLSLYKWTAQGSLNIDDAGLSVSKSETRSIASDAKIFRFERQLLKDGFNWLERVLNYLNDNLTEFTEYKDSEAYKNSKKYFINTVADFNAHYNIQNSRITFNSILDVMDQVEQSKIVGTIGEEFFIALKELILGTSEISPENKKAISMLQKAIVYFTISDAIPLKNVEFTDFGIFINAFIGRNDSQLEKNPASESRLSNLQSKLLIYGEEQLKRTLDYLNQTASESVFTEFFESDKYTDPNLKSTYKSPNTQERGIFLT